MLTVTESAVSHLTTMLEGTKMQAMLAGDELSEEPALRLINRGNELTLIVDSEHEDDQVLAVDEHPVLLVEPELSDALEGVILDAVEGPDGKELTIVRSAG